MLKGKKRWRGCRRKCSSYKERDELLRKAGFPSYRAYLASPLWAAIRRTVLDRDKGACRLCGGRAERVHHRTYTRSGLKGSNLGQLAALCRDCHRQVEVSPGGVKRDLREAEAEYRRLEGERARTLKGCPQCST